MNNRELLKKLKHLANIGCTYFIEEELQICDDYFEVFDRSIEIMKESLRRNSCKITSTDIDKVKAIPEIDYFFGLDKDHFYRASALTVTLRGKSIKQKKQTLMELRERLVEAREFIYSNCPDADKKIEEYIAKFSI